MFDYLINPYGIIPKQHADPIFEDRKCYNWNMKSGKTNIYNNFSITKRNNTLETTVLEYNIIYFTYYRNIPCIMLKKSDNKASVFKTKEKKHYDHVDTVAYNGYLYNRTYFIKIDKYNNKECLIPISNIKLNCKVLFDVNDNEVELEDKVILILQRNIRKILNFL